MIQKFEEVLDDGWSCFLLGNPFTLLKFKEDNRLPDNLQTVFTTSESGDDAVREGAVIYLYNMKEHYDYGFTVYFNYGEKTIFEELDVSPIHYVQGYIAEVISGRLTLYRWTTLHNYTKEAVEQVVELSRSESDNPVFQTIELPNGWYQIDVKVGYTNENDPMIEFLIKETEHQSVQVDLNTLTSYNFELPRIK